MKRADPLMTLRLVFVAFPIALLLILYVLQVLTSDAPNGHTPAWVGWALVACGLAALVGVSWARARPLPVSDQAALAASYRSNLFLGVAFAEFPALVGFAIVILTAELWPYLEGLAFALVGFALIAPIPGNIERRQQQITAQGSPLSLTEALRTTPPGGR